MSQKKLISLEKKCWHANQKLWDGSCILILTKRGEMEKIISPNERLIPFKLDLPNILHTNKPFPPLPLRVVLLKKRKDSENPCSKWN